MFYWQINWYNFYVHSDFINILVIILNKMLWKNLTLNENFKLNNTFNIINLTLKINYKCFFTLKRSCRGGGGGGVKSRENP